MNIFFFKQINYWNTILIANQSKRSHDIVFKRTNLTKWFKRTILSHGHYYHLTILTIIVMPCSNVWFHTTNLLYYFNLFNFVHMFYTSCIDTRFQIYLIFISFYFRHILTTTKRIKNQNWNRTPTQRIKFSFPRFTFWRWFEFIIFDLRPSFCIN